MKSKNLWPLGIMLTFVFFITGTTGLVVLACRQKSDLVSANYYEEEVRFQSQIDRSERTRKLSQEAAVTYNAAQSCITILLPVKEGQQVTAGRIQLYRPSESKLDRQVDLNLDPNGAQIINATQLKNGLWKVKVSWTADGEDYFVDRKVIVASRRS
jgi:nitrogen fixation protein FixH